MALISCGECGNQVSDKASSCPKCGNPISSGEAPSQPVTVQTAGVGVVTTQATGKAPKIMQAVGALLIIIGTVSCSTVDWYVTEGGRQLPPLASTWSWIVGLALFLIGRISAWWRHG